MGKRTGKKRPHSLEYLNAALEKARSMLPGWMFAMIHEAALPSSGGRARAARRRLEAEAAAKVSEGLADVETMPDAVLQTVTAACEEIGLTKAVGVCKAEVAKREAKIQKGEERTLADEYLSLLLKGETITPPNALSMMVLEKHDDGLTVALLDGDEEFVEKAEGIDPPEGSLVDVVDGIAVAVSKALLPHSKADEVELNEAQELASLMAPSIPFTGPSDARVVFLTAAPNAIEAARGEALIGDDAAAFDELYLGPLGIGRDDVGIGFISPHWIPDPVDVSKIAPWLNQVRVELAKFKSARVVAVGKVAREVLGSLAHVTLPHPSAVRKRWDTEELERKIRTLKKSIDKKERSPEHGDHSKSDPPSKGWIELHRAGAKGGRQAGLECKFASAGEKQIVYGVVLDPYRLDSHGDWIPPAEIERAAHEFMKTSRIVGLEHSAVAQAQIVESWVEDYPTLSDYQAAHAGVAHRAYRTKYGDDVVSSGTWLIGVQLSDELWTAFKAGEITGFSIGGFSARDQIDSAVMPTVTFIDLEPKQQV